MAEGVKVKMLRAVGGFDVGATRTMPAADARRLEERGVVKILAEAKKEPPPANKKAPAHKNKSAG